LRIGETALRVHRAAARTACPVRRRAPSVR